MFNVTSTTIKRKTRKDAIVHLRQRYTGKLDTPRAYNAAFAGVLRALADRLELIDDAWADPEVLVWLHQPGEITAEIPLSPPVGE